MCVSLYVHIFVCCFCLHACVGVEQIHVIWVIDILPPAVSWSQCLMEMRFKIHPFFFFPAQRLLQSYRRAHGPIMTPTRIKDDCWWRTVSFESWRCVLIPSVICTCGLHNTIFSCRVSFIGLSIKLKLFPKQTYVCGSLLMIIMMIMIIL